MIYILSWTTKKHQNILFKPTHSKLRTFLRTFQGLAQTFKDFSRKNGIHGEEFSRLCRPCVNLLLKAHIDWLAHEQALEGALVVGQEKEG